MSLFRYFLFILLIPLVYSCLGNDGLRTGAIADNNVLNLSKISVGMKECEVMSIMKEPYSKESFTIDQSEFNVWFYVTTPTVLGQTRFVAANLTPLTFKNGELIGWGSSYYKYLVKRKKIEAREASLIEKSMPSQGDQGQTAPQQQPSNKPNWGPVTPPAKQNAQPGKNNQDAPPPPPPPPAVQPAPTKPNTQQPGAPAKPAQQPTPKAAPTTAATDGPAESNCPNGKCPAPSKPKTKSDTPPKKQPLDEEDQKMLQDASDYEFNQT